MNKKLFFALSLALLLTLTACGGGDKQPGKDSGTQAPSVDSSVGSPVVTSTPADPKDAAEVLDIPESAVEELLDSGFTLAERNTAPDRTVDELIELIKAGPSVADSAPYSDPEPGLSLDLGDIAASQSQGTAVTFSTEPWEDKDVEMLDVTQDMTSEEKAEWEEFLNTDWEAMVAETENMVTGLTESFDDMGDLGDTGDVGEIPDVGEVPDIDVDDLQSQLDQALKDAQEQLAGSGLDLGDLGLGDIDLGSLLGGLN